MAKFDKHRFLGRLDKALNGGRASFFINSSNLHRIRYQDYFFFDLAKGYIKISDSLRYYFLEYLNYDYFMKISFDYKTPENYLYTFYDINGAVKSEQIINNSTDSESSLGDVSLTSDEDQDEKIDEALTNRNLHTNTATAQSLHGIIDKVLDTNHKVAIFMECFDHVSGMYQTEKNMDYINRLQHWQTLNSLDIKNKVLIVNLESIEELKSSYHIEFDEEQDNFLQFGVPNGDEVFYSLLYKLAQTDRDNPFPSDKHFIDCAELMSTDDRTLYEIINYFDKNYSDIANNGEEFIRQNFISSKNQRTPSEWDDIILDNNIKTQIKTSVAEFLDGEDSKKGLVLFGPPGTGKTEIAKAVAYSNNCSFKSITIDDLKQGYVGQSAQAVKELFSELETKDSVILFIDECDSLFPERNGAQGDSYTDDIVNAMLPRIDGVNSGKSKIFFIGATNNYTNLDKAIKSRFHCIEIPLPDSDSRNNILKLNLDKYNISYDETDVFFEPFVSNRMDGFSGRDIKEFVLDVRKAMLANNINSFTEQVAESSLRSFEAQEIESLKSICPSIEIKSTYDKNAFDLVLGYRGLKDELKKHLAPISFDSQRYQYFISQIGVEKGLLFYGPPGNGKSFIMSQLAISHNLYFIKVLSKDLHDYRKINQLFNSIDLISKMTYKAGVLLFFDEADGLFQQGVPLEVRSSFLDCFADKKYRENQKFYLGAATNFIDVLDDAAIRAGRFDKHLKLPGIRSYSEFMEYLISFFNEGNYELSENINFEKLFEYLQTKKNCNRYDKDVAISDIRKIVNDIKRNIFLENRTSLNVTQTDVDLLLETNYAY